MSKARRIWVLADAHIGHVVDGRDGAEWLELAIADARENLGPIDYVINLGDVGHTHAAEQLARYDAIIQASGLGPWFHVVGNHDFATLRDGLWDRYIRGPRYWRVDDGNLAILSLPAERGNAAGLLVPPVEAWLRSQIGDCGGRNVVMAAHSFPYDTVERSTRPARCLYPRDAVAKFLADVRIDLWLGGHIHSIPRTPACGVRRDGTAFINTSSVSHVYGTKACNSLLIEIAPGGRTALVRCREHDTGRFLDDQQIEAPLPFAFEPGGGGPVQTPFDLDVSPAYSRIEEEQVLGFDLPAEQ